MTSTLALMTALLAKHFIADFPLQTKYMLGKFGPYPKYILPLLAHSAVHVFTTLLILAFFLPPPLAAGVALAEGALHFGIDRVKASPQLLGRWAPSSPYFWWALGADQLAHGLCYVGICAIVGAQ